MSLVEIKDFNLLTNKKTFFDEPVINKQEAFEKLVFHYIICTIKNMKLSVYIHEAKQMPVLLSKLISQKN